MNLKYSANLGFLWDHLPLLDRIKAAADAGFDGCEFHFPYDHAAQDIASTLKANNLPMVGLNTPLGPEGEDYFGVTALAGKEELARGCIDKAISYAATCGANYVSVVAGVSNGVKTSEATYQENLSYACKQAAASGLTIVIEPLNPRAKPNYHFSTVEQAIATIDAVGADNLKLMFDFYHAQIVQGDLTTLLNQYSQYLGHIQLAAIHDRGEPDQGEVNYPFVLEVLDKNGYSGYIGAEYKPRGESVESGLGWLKQFRQL